MKWSHLTYWRNIGFWSPCNGFWILQCKRLVWYMSVWLCACAYILEWNVFHDILSSPPSFASITIRGTRKTEWIMNNGRRWRSNPVTANNKKTHHPIWTKTDTAAWGAHSVPKLFLLLFLLLCFLISHQCLVVAAEKKNKNRENCEYFVKTNVFFTFSTPITNCICSTARPTRGECK